MREFRRVLIVGAAILAVIGVGILLGLLVAHHGAPHSEPITIKSDKGVLASADTNQPGGIAKHTPSHAPDGELGTVSTSGELAANVITNWEDKIDEVFNADVDIPETAKRFLDLLPKFPPAGQKEVVEHLSNLLDDADYPRLGQYLTNASMAPLVLDALMTDALDRPDSMKLPLFLQVARNPEHPKAGEAKELLETYLDDYIEEDENLDDDWALWEKKLQEYLKDNPD